uniref:Uncharacterized protein n=1 Tax=Panagrolaimus sp. PS1159 TaxID=55785 RepID=A0AC35GXC3_9BILA
MVPPPFNLDFLDGDVARQVSIGNARAMAMAVKAYVDNKFRGARLETRENRERDDRAVAQDDDELRQRVLQVEGTLNVFDERLGLAVSASQRCDMLLNTLSTNVTNQALIQGEEQDIEVLVLKEGI